MPEVRCAISPLFELWQSIGALQAPESKELLLPWIAATLDRTRDLGRRREREQSDRARRAEERAAADVRAEAPALFVRSRIHGPPQAIQVRRSGAVLDAPACRRCTLSLPSRSKCFLNRS